MSCICCGRGTIASGPAALSSKLQKLLPKRAVPRHNKVRGRVGGMDRDASPRPTIIASSRGMRRGFVQVFRMCLAGAGSCARSGGCGRYARQGAAHSGGVRLDRTLYRCACRLQPTCDGDPWCPARRPLECWVPAFAGTTVMGIAEPTRHHSITRTGLPSMKARMSSTTPAK